MVLFSNLVFLILILLLVNLSPIDSTIGWAFSPWNAFLCGIGIYILLLMLIIGQNFFRKKWKMRKRGRLLIFVNCELLLFFSLFYYGLGADRILTHVPFIGNLQIFSSLFTLTLYFVAIFVFHITSHSTFLSRQGDWHLSSPHASTQLRLIIPFAIPYILYTAIIDFVSLGSNVTYSETSLIIGTLIFMLLAMMLLPYLIQSVWKCTDIEDSELKTHLEKLCKRAHFKHAGIKSWTILQDSLTAAILGIVPRYRYVIFTKRLLKEFSIESLEAILAHEIGHSYRKHLVIFPFIFLGIAVCMSLLSYFFTEAIDNFFLLENHLHPSILWNGMASFIIFLAYALLFGLYFRIVFGFFSRQFERQADLHVYKLDISPLELINALDHIGIATGYSHRVPNWHHYSIQERIDFLRKTIEDPSKIDQHHRFVFWSLVTYFIFLILGIYILTASLWSGTPGFSSVNTVTEQMREKVNHTLNHSFYHELAKKTMIENSLKGNLSLILDILEESFIQTGGTNPFPIEGYFAAIKLRDQGELSAAATLLTQVWKNLNEEIKTKAFLVSLNQLHESINSRLIHNDTYDKDASELRTERQYALKKFITPSLDEK